MWNLVYKGTEDVVWSGGGSTHEKKKPCCSFNKLNVVQLPNNLL